MYIYIHMYIHIRIYIHKYVYASPAVHPCFNASKEQSERRPLRRSRRCQCHPADLQPGGRSAGGWRAGPRVWDLGLWDSDRNVWDLISAGALVLSNNNNNNSTNNNRVFGAHCALVITRRPQNSIGKYLCPYITYIASFSGVVYVNTHTHTHTQNTHTHTHPRTSFNMVCVCVCLCMYT